MPISLRQCILLNRAEQAGYGRTLNSEPVQELTRRTRFFAGEHFVVSKNHTEPIWFEVGDIPDDAWEKVQAPDEDDDDDLCELQTTPPT